MMKRGREARLLAVAIVLTFAIYGSAAATTCQPGGTGTVYTCTYSCITTNCGPANGCNGATPCVICATAADENITGTTNQDIICGGGGHDTIDAKGGDDYIDLGPTGGSTVTAGGGIDTVYGSAGDDVIYGEDGNDTIYGGGGADILIGGTGADTISQGVATNREQPDDFSSTNPVNDFSITVTGGGLTRYLSPSNWIVCGTTLTGPSFATPTGGPITFGFVGKEAGGTRLNIKPAYNSTTSTSVGTEVNFIAPTRGKYDFVGAFARMSGCSTGTLNVAINPGGFSASIGTSDFSDHTFSISQLALKQGDAVVFSVTNSTYNADDVVQLELAVTPHDMNGGTIDETIGSTLCGGTGDDTLKATGPGHVCLSGGTGTDTCTFTAFSVPPREMTRDFGTAMSDCETATGTDPRYPGCGCP